MKAREKSPMSSDQKSARKYESKILVNPELIRLSLQTRPVASVQPLSRI